MGNCCTVEKNRPKLKKYKWKSSTPITKEEILRKRETFWHTAASYEGKIEIWQALKAAIDAEDIEMAKLIIESANITLTGEYLNEVYDELGTKYCIPDYCLSFPSNMLLSLKETKSTESINMSVLKSQMYRVRTSSGNDFSLDLYSHSTVSDVKLKLSELTSRSKDLYLMFYMGKPLEDSQPVYEYKDGILQAMYRNSE